jgi:hypothetical protein
MRHSASIGGCDPSIITEVNPHRRFQHDSTLEP